MEGLHADSAADTFYQSVDYFFIKKEIDTSQSSLLNICFGFFLPLLPLAFPTLLLNMCVCRRNVGRLSGGCNILFFSWVLVESPKKLRAWVLIMAMNHALGKGV